MMINITQVIMISRKFYKNATKKKKDGEKANNVEKFRKCCKRNKVGKKSTHKNEEAKQIKIGEEKNLLSTILIVLIVLVLYYTDFFQYLDDIACLIKFFIVVIMCYKICSTLKAAFNAIQYFAKICFGLNLIKIWNLVFQNLSSDNICVVIFIIIVIFENVIGPKLKEAFDTIKYFIKICVGLIRGQPYIKETLHDAAKNGNLDICQQLVSRGVTIDDLDSGGGTPLYYAAESNQLDVTRYLLEKGANPNVKCQFPLDGTILQAAVGKGYLDICRLLVAKGASINESNSLPDQTALHCAARKSREICELLITKGATIDAFDPFDRTPLYYSITYKKLDVTKYLLENGANSNSECFGQEYYNITNSKKEKFREKMLHVAAREGNLDLCQLLVLKGADMNCLNSKDETPLMIALENSLSSRNDTQKYLSIAEYFLKNKLVYNSELNGDVKDKFMKLFKQVAASKHIFQKLKPWHPNMCKLASEKSDGSLKSFCRDVIWKNIDNSKISDIVNRLNISECLRRYIIYEEELRCG
ncbi:hypothetical protein QYM36_003020 [Artemia franciscana]|uniref:Uncharacterized protein n=1 Tax=Artemia franciscana TaxID=6661 RepID=A0AA88I9Y4_ARTSF|nr:hypothetical protein QYM36_003020 [Artemia franciscana]